MANLPETDSFDAGVYQLETTDPCLGGADGVDNAAARNLANRTNYLKKRIEGMLSKSVAGSADVILTASEANNSVLELTGVLTGDISVIVPSDAQRNWIVRNNTSGDYALTVKTAAGTGVIVKQGLSADVYTDGTNVYPSGSSDLYTGKGIQRFTTNGSFTVPDGVTEIYVSGCAGGGGSGGGGGNSTTGPKIGSGGGGGGAGQFIIKEPYAVTPGETISITIGAGGVAGLGVNGADGTNGGTGGDTVIGTLATLTGGGGGTKGVSLSASNSVPGPGGGAGYPKGGHAADATNGNSSGHGGSGASGPFGGGGAAGRGATGAAVSGSPGYGYGAGGGGGGGCYSSSTTNPGGNGSAGMPGIAIIEW
jgi:hypothetical protein